MARGGNRSDEGDGACAGMAEPSLSSEEVGGTERSRSDSASTLVVRQGWSTGGAVGSHLECILVSVDIIDRNRVFIE